jgi:MFS family permease
MSRPASARGPAAGQATRPWERPISQRTLLGVSAVCFLAWFFSVYDYTLFGTLLPQIADTFGWSTAHATAVATWVTVGTFVVALSVGPLLDRVGRKRALVITVLGAALSSGLTGVAVGAVSLVLIRALSGFGYSEELVNTVYLNEMYGKTRSRGFMYSIVQSGWPVGALVAAGLTAVLLPLVGWRWCFVIATVPAVLVAVLATRLPESPAFLALKEVRGLRAAGRTEESVALAADLGLEDAGHQHATLRDVFAPGVRLHTVALSLAWLFNWMAIQVFSVLGTTVLVDAKGVSFNGALIVLVLANAAAFLGYLCHGWVGDRVGRRPTIIVGWLIGGATSTLMLVGPDNAGFVIGMYALTLFFLTGPYAALLFYMGESFPAHLRGLGPNVAHTMGPVGAIAGSALLSLMLSVGASMTVAAFVAGSIWLFLSGVVMLFTRHVRQHGADAPVADPVVS